MGLENTLPFLENDVFIRTDLGLEEVANVSNSVLPREARTLLILIDGRKTYAQVTRLLENRKMFKSAGGLRHYLQMLIDLDYIDNKFSAIGVSKDKLKGHLSTKSAEPREVTLFTKALSPEEEDKLLQAKSLAEHRQALEQLRNIVSQLISKYSGSSENESYLAQLNGCNSSRCILQLVNKLQNSSSGELAAALKMTVKAFKRAKIS